MNVRLFAGMTLLALLLVLAVSADAQSRRKPAPGSELKLLMTQPGKTLLDEPFTAESWKKNWQPYKGGYEIVKDQLRVAENAADGHHPEASFRGPFENVIVQFKFKYDDCKWMGFSFSDKEHIARVMIRADGFELLKMQGIGSTTKGTKLDSIRVKWETGRWYTMTIEVAGNEIIAQVDNEHVLYGEAEGLEVPKKFFLISSGPHAWFDELKIIESQPDPAWTRRKPAVLEQKARRN